MRHPGHQRARERYARVFRNPDLAGELLTHDFTVDGKALEVQELRYYSEEPPAPGMTLEASVPYGVYSPPAEGAKVTVNIGLAGSSMMRTFTGRLLRPVRGGETLSLIAVSPGYYQERFNYYRLFGALAEFTGRVPSDVAHELIARTRLYHGLNIPIVDKPLFTQTEGDAFDVEATIGQILEALRDASGLWVFDDGRAFCKGMTLDKLEEPGEPVVRWQVGKHIPPSTFTYAVREEERYRDITYYRMVNDELEMMIGNPAYHESQFVDVPYRSARAKPPVGVTLATQTEDTDEAIALGLALKTAGALNAGAYTFEFQTAFIDPRVERGDTLAWTETVFEGEDRVERLWRGVVGYMEHSPKEGSALYGGVGNIYRTETTAFVADPLPTAHKSVGVVGVG